jgi:cell division protein FtsL
MAAHARVRTRPAPRHPRRISGPVARPVPAGAPPLRRGSTGVLERIRALPETRLVDGLLRGRAWIWLIGILLGGIVAMQVSLLKLNAGISNAVTTTSTLQRENADIEAEIAKLSSIERVRDAATSNDMVTPAPGDVSFLHARPDRDALRAAQRMAPPSDSAAAVMENGGREPGVLATTPVSDPIAVATPDPSTSTSTSTATTATPEATATPVPTATPAPLPPAAQNGATVAPQG